MYMQMKGVFPDWFKLNGNMTIFTKRFSLLLQIFTNFVTDKRCCLSNKDIEGMKTGLKTQVLKFMIPSKQTLKKSLDALVQYLMDQSTENYANVNET